MGLGCVCGGVCVSVGVFGLWVCDFRLLATCMHARMDGWMDGWMSDEEHVSSLPSIYTFLLFAVAELTGGLGGMRDLEGAGAGGESPFLPMTVWVDACLCMTHLRRFSL